MEDPELMSIRELFGHWRERLGMDSYQRAFALTHWGEARSA